MYTIMLITLLITSKSGETIHFERLEFTILGKKKKAIGGLHSHELLRERERERGSAFDPWDALPLALQTSKDQESVNGVLGNQILAFSFSLRNLQFFSPSLSLHHEKSRTHTKAYFFHSQPSPFPLPPFLTLLIKSPKPQLQHSISALLFYLSQYPSTDSTLQDPPLLLLLLLSHRTVSHLQKILICIRRLPIHERAWPESKVEVLESDSFQIQ